MGLSAKAWNATPCGLFPRPEEKFEQKVRMSELGRELIIGKVERRWPYFRIRVSLVVAELCDKSSGVDAMRAIPVERCTESFGIKRRYTKHTQSRSLLRSLERLQGSLA